MEQLNFSRFAKKKKTLKILSLSAKKIYQSFISNKISK